GGGTASLSQVGDRSWAIDQNASFGTGDAVGGAQVTGTVSGDDSATTVQNQNAVSDVEAVTGDIGTDGSSTLGNTIGKSPPTSSCGSCQPDIFDSFGPEAAVKNQD